MFEHFDQFLAGLLHGHTGVALFVDHRRQEQGGQGHRPVEGLELDHHLDIGQPLERTEALHSGRRGGHGREQGTQHAARKREAQGARISSGWTRKSRPWEHSALQRDGRLDLGTLQLGALACLGGERPESGQQLVAVVHCALAGHRSLRRGGAHS
ncbi:hypothetical protein GCM10010121_002930 [Streptomyces brasiliensis]|uniref:Uncharacterized protein n=1 Tax=Streptomyces brasiliensis TaxID=1954 RepID=A0A917NFH6_9ACTN|nr:hypothetical protein GCM10010121_002930 [Streptomyces brasiliensis]